MQFSNFFPLATPQPSPSTASVRASGNFPVRDRAGEKFSRRERERPKRAGSKNLKKREARTCTRTNTHIDEIRNPRARGSSVPRLKVSYRIWESSQLHRDHESFVTFQTRKLREKLPAQGEEGGRELLSSFLEEHVERTCSQAWILRNPVFPGLGNFRILEFPNNSCLAETRGLIFTEYEMSRVYARRNFSLSLVSSLSATFLSLFAPLPLALSFFCGCDSTATY